MSHNPKQLTFPVPRFSCILLTLLLCAATRAQGADPTNRYVVLKPSDPTDRWEVTHLEPMQQANYTVDVIRVEGSYRYVTSGVDRIESNIGADLMWTVTRPQPPPGMAARFKCHVVNTEWIKGQAVVGITCLWERVAAPGPGPGPGREQLDLISGWATGIVNAASYLDLSPNPTNICIHAPAFTVSAWLLQAPDALDNRRPEACRWSLAPAANGTINNPIGTAVSVTAVTQGLLSVSAETLRGVPPTTATVAVPIIKVYIVDPEWTPDFPGDYSDVSYTFNSASPGVCTIPVEGTCGVPALNPNLEWELESMSGSTLGSTPDPAKGANVTYTYTTLPSANSEFGQKILSLGYPGSGCFAAVGIRIFFGKNASNNPGGSEPNWYYYWSQTSANYGTHTYNAHNDDYGHVDWGGSAWDAYICNLTGNTSIDWFGHVCRHEAQHVTDLTAWWPSGPPIDADGDGVTDNDADGDLVPDTLEPSLGYDPNLLDTDGDGYRDVEDHAYDNQPSWTYGSADTEDWANPGAQLTSP